MIIKITYNNMTRGGINIAVSESRVQVLISRSETSMSITFAANMDLSFIYLVMHFLPVKLLEGVYMGNDGTAEQGKKLSFYF